MCLALARKLSVQSCCVSLVHVAASLNSYFTVLTFTRGECVILLLVCFAFSVPRAPDCDVDAVVGGSVFSRTDCRQ